MLAGGLAIGGITGSVVIARRGLDGRTSRVAGPLTVAGVFVTAAPVGLGVQVAGLAAAALNFEAEAKAALVAWGEHVATVIGHSVSVLPFPQCR